MRATEFVTELFEPKTPTWEWMFRGSEEATADFNVGEIPYRFHAYSNGENDWEVEFKVRTSDDSRDARQNLKTRFGLTGTGNSAEVMSTVVDIMREFLEMYRGKIDTIGFTAEEPSRQKLYMRMMKRLLPNWDIHTYDSGSGLGFTVVAPEQIDERNNGNRWTGNELYRIIGDEGIDEGVVDWAKKGAAAGAIALGALGAGQADAKPHPTHKTAIVQPAKHQAPEEFNALSHNIDNEVTLQKAARKAGIKGQELAQFMAQMKHESWDFERMKEKPQPGVKDYYNKRYDLKYSPKTAKILGNKHVGDGARYHGRGFVQLTGRDNYRMASDALGIDLLKNPELASKPDVAAKIAVWYWQTRVKPGIQNFADTKAVTQKINPAMRGVDSRHANFKDYLRII